MAANSHIFVISHIDLFVSHNVICVRFICHEVSYKSNISWPAKEAFTLKSLLNIKAIRSLNILRKKKVILPLQLFCKLPKRKIKIFYFKFVDIVLH